MKTVTIHRCPTCHTIGGHTDRLLASLKDDPDLKVDVVDGAKGEFSVEVDGRRIRGKSGEVLRNVSEITGEIRDAHIHAT